jgi:hypothetical protein
MRLAFLAVAFAASSALAAPPPPPPPDCEDAQTWRTWEQTRGALPSGCNCNQPGTWRCTPPRGFKLAGNGEIPTGFGPAGEAWLNTRSASFQWGQTVDFTWQRGSSVVDYKARIQPHCHPPTERGNHCWHKGFTLYVSTGRGGTAKQRDVRAACKKDANGKYALYSWLMERERGEFTMTCDGARLDKREAKETKNANVVGYYRPDGFFFHGLFNKVQKDSRCKASFVGLNPFSSPSGVTGQSELVTCL